MGGLCRLQGGCSSVAPLLAVEPWTVASGPLSNPLDPGVTEYFERQVVNAAALGPVGYSLWGTPSGRFRRRLYVGWSTIPLSW
jgi:hypothetical protein